MHRLARFVRRDRHTSTWGDRNSRLLGLIFGLLSAAGLVAIGLALAHRLDVAASTVTSTTLVSSVNPSSAGQSVTFIATVTPGTATGTVTFDDGSTVLGSVPLSGGKASLAISTLSTGNHSITAVYGGDVNDSGSTSSPLVQTVRSVTSTGLTSSPNPSSYGQAVTLSASLTPTSATGSVTFKDGTTTLGSATLTSGSATLATSTLVTGSHSITAVYGGDATNAPSTSQTLTQNVSQAATTTTLTASPNPSTYGASVTFKATLSQTSATGTVTFTNGSTTLGTAALSGGVASLTTTSLAVGSHSVTASYPGDTNHLGSTSAAVTETVGQAVSKTALGSSANPATAGQAVTFTATVAPASATGSVTFMDGSAALATVTLSSGNATFTTSSLATGVHSMTAAYGGDTNDAASTSGVLSQAIRATSSTALASSLNPSTFGKNVTFTATVSPSGATGTVTFKDGTTTLGTGAVASNGTATLTTTSLTVASHSITAVYGGDTTHVGSTSAALTQTVNQAVTTTTLASAPNPSTSGQSVLFKAVVAPAAATGTITFKDGTTTLATVTLSSGAATFTTSSLAVGSHSITAAYSGDANDTASTSAVLTQTVRVVTTTTLTSSLNPSKSGQAVTFTATVSPSSATGTVTFKDSGTTLGTATVTSGSATLTTSALTAGTHSITAVYSGDTSNGPSTSAAVNQTVLAATTTHVTSSANPSLSGQSVTFTASVAPAGATGTVTFSDGSTTLGTGALSSGAASFTTSSLAVGNHSITAAYSGDSSHAGSSGGLTQMVRLASTTTVASSLNPSTFGKNVTFTATVSPAGATGTVTFKDGMTTLGTGTVASNGTATLSTTSLTVASHSITAAYGGDTTYLGSTSAALTQTVNQAVTTTTLASAPNPSTSGQSVLFKAVVAPAAATGTITFKDGTTTLATVTLSSGAATFTTSSLAVGSHSITAAYSGDANDTASTTAVLTQTVRVATTTTVTSSLNPSQSGQAVTFTATVSPSSATGTVTFKDGGTTLGTATVTSGSATLTTSALAAGAHSIVAVYGGDTSNGPSTSAAVNQTVLAATTTHVTSSANPSLSGQSVTFTASVAPAGATGTVTFSDGSTTLGTGALSSGSATFTTSSLAVGNHSITAAYSGDSSHAGSSGGLTQMVRLASTTTVTSSSNPSTYALAVSFTASVSPSAATGTVSFKDGTTTLGTGSLSSGSATFTTSSLSVGSHSITAVYGGDTTYLGGTSATLTQKVNQAASSTSVAAAPNPATSGQAVTLKATVAPSAATGIVTFYDGTAALGSASLTTGTASFTTSSLAVGSHNITAAYGGDTNYAGSSSAMLNETILAATTTSLTSSMNPSTAGTAVTFTASVAPAGATGTVTFKDGSTTLGTVALISGSAAFTTSSLGAGTHAITATYNGDTGHAASTSPVVNQTVRFATTTALTSSANPSTAGQSVTFTATISPTAFGGTVTFKDGTTVLATVNVSSGTASFSTSSLSVGTHSITAVYSGDATHAGSTSALLSQTVH